MKTIGHIRSALNKLGLPTSSLYVLHLLGAEQKERFLSGLEIALSEPDEKRRFLAPDAHYARTIVVLGSHEFLERLSSWGISCDAKTIGSIAQSENEVRRVFDLAKNAEEGITEDLKTLEALIERHHNNSHTASHERVESKSDTPPQTAVIEDEQPSSGGALAAQHSSHHVYTQKGVICFSTCYSPSDEARNSFHIEATEANIGKSGFNWENKVNIRLSPNELPEVIALLLGHKDSINLQGHGAKHNKSFQAKLQTNHIFMQVFEARRAISVPMNDGDKWCVLTMIATYLAKVQGLSFSDLLSVTNQVYGKPHLQKNL